MLANLHPDFVSSKSQVCRNIIYCVFIFLFFQISSVSAQTLRAYTEDWPPYSFIQDNEVTGISTDILRAACAGAKIQCEFQLVPWTRAYKTVQETPNTLIYSIARVPTREQHFVWVGPILPRTTWIYVRKEVAEKIHSIKDVSKFRVGLIRAEASVNELVLAGVPESAIRIFNSNTDVMRTVKSGNLDVLVNTEIGMAMNQKNFDIPADSFVRLMKLYDGGGLYFGMHLDSDPALIEKLQASLEKLRRESKIQSIVQQYTKTQ
jgi:polar amino acid transport system substrate-binding protein